MKALVTGGGGFLGTRIAQMLHARGDVVVVSGRHAYPHLEDVGISTIRADLRDARAILEACRGKDVVFHVGALTGIWGPKKAFWETNVEGTRHVIDACRACGVAKLVYASSPSVVFGDDDLCGVDESQPYPDRYLAYYPQSKATAEQMVLAANDESLATVALRPHLIWGPGDPHLIPRVIERAREGKLVQVGDGRNLVDVCFIDNAAEAHLQAADALAPGAACAGRAYFISQGEPVELWPWLNGILASLGIPPATRSISYGSARLIGVTLETAFKVLRLEREPRMTRLLAAQLAKNHYFNITAAREDFGYVPRVPIADGLTRLLESLGGKRGQATLAVLEEAVRP